MIKAIGRRAAALGLCVLCLMSCAFAQEAPKLLDPVGVQVDSVQVRRGEISEQTAYSGAVVPAVVELYFEQEGVVEEVLVSVGQMVRAGDVLVTLNRETEQERMDELKEQIIRLETTGSYEERLAQIDLAMLDVQIKQLRTQGSQNEDAAALKELEREERRLAMEYDADVRQLQLKRLKAELDALDQESARAAIIAPVDGQVMYLSSIGRGSYVTAYTPQIYLADESRLTVETEYVHGSTLDRADDMYALIGGEKYAVEPLPVDESDYISKVLTGETVNTAFQVNAPEAVLSAGEFAAVVLVNSRREDALIIPANALFRDGLTAYVYVMENGVRHRRNVQTGVITDWDVQIVDGLQEGEWVYVEE